ncbi:MAG: hypothetical protein HKO70_16660, partial [Acidimicrobiia bacterium]|nr:hypothetical protein [Acidimicrobiia bacterium]
MGENQLEQFDRLVGASEGHYEERWEFIGPDTYEWSLWARTGAGLEQAMSGT